MTRTMRLPWRTAAGAVPAIVLVASGIALATTGGNPATDIVADSAPLVTVPDTALQHLDAPELPSLPELPAPDEAEPTPLYQGAGLPSSMSANGIPAAALDAYRRAATIVDAADAECRIDWALIAAIGKVESNHGRYGGNGIDRDGTVRPGIYGIPLNGQNNTARISDTDGGSYDRDATWDRAVGPMQFIPGTWRVVGVDANGDGRKDPQNIADAATATAVYLCSGPGDLSTEPGARSAVLRYNHSDAYADQVLAIAAGYRGGYTVVPASDLTAGQRSDSPFLPSGEPRPMATYDPVAASKPAPKPGSKPGKGGSTKPGSGTGGGTGGSATPTPTPSSTSGGGVTDVVGGVVGGIVGGITGSTPTPTSSTPQPSTTPTPTPTTPALPLQVLPVGGKCPTGYDPVLNVLGVVVLCTLHS
ncbi:Membrane-bound lytic murein transglycosylase B [Pedococcus dokdonensis]|uniref:Membrane-bound lytic murein transglycosylase B n=1 Tax=Pedococcus dokdonensis TaxID=443156 RepID=A0A1H0SMI0_9MICO|nr:lytic transglycosylase domain-containing protein [Pedococcus dokdonensis]SDP42448.1 Membrane-bound lytic murein transglycosylase B [Pedococcus dokdonensis]